MISLFCELRPYKLYASTTNGTGFFLPILVKELKYLKINETLILDCLNELYKNAQVKQKYK